MALREERRQVIADFERDGIAYLIEVCDRSEKVLQDEQDKYGLWDPDRRVASAGELEQEGAPTDSRNALKDAVRALIQQRDAAQHLGEEATYEREGSGIGPFDADQPASDIESDTEGGAEGDTEGYGDLGADTANEASVGANAAQQEFEAARDRTVQEFPILRRFMDPERAKDLEALPAQSSTVLGSSLAAEARDNLEQIRKLRDNARSGGVEVWQLPLLVEAAKRHLGFLPNTFRASLVDDRLKEYGDNKLVSTLILSAVALALGIIGAIPTGGMSLAAAGGVAGAQVGSAVIGGAMLWQDVATFRLEDQASIIDLVDDPSTFGLLLDMGLSLLDLKGLTQLSKAFAPARAAANSRSLARASLQNLEPGRAGSIALRNAVAEMGINETCAVSNRSIDDLVRIAADDPTLVAKLRAAQVAPFSLDQVHAAMKELGSAPPARVSEIGEAMARAVDLEGALPVLRATGGWDKVVLAFSDGSPVSQRLMGWRDDVVGGELRDFGATLTKGSSDPNGLVRTGTTGKPSNDFDWSTLGPHSAANRDATYQFLEARFGLARGEVHVMLHGDLFTDPRRLHLYDELEPGLREKMARAETESSEKFVYNRMLHEAKQRNVSPEYQQKLVAKMEARGLGAPGYIEMTAGDIRRLSVQIDDWHQALQSAATIEARERLVTQIGQAQGQINAIERGGYLTGGGAAGFARVPDGSSSALTKPELSDLTKPRAIRRSSRPAIEALRGHGRVRPAFGGGSRCGLDRQAGRGHQTDRQVRGALQRHGGKGAGFTAHHRRPLGNPRASD